MHNNYALHPTLPYLPVGAAYSHHPTTDMKSINQTINSPPQGSAKAKFFENLEADRSRGLKDIKFFPGDLVGASEEDIYNALNAMETAENSCNTEIFKSGKTVFA